MEVIILDDDEITAYLHQVFLRDSKFHKEPLLFYTASGLLKYLENHYSREKEYCLFLDLNMPLMDGWQFLERLQKFQMIDNFHVVIITSSIDESDRAKAFRYPKVIEYLEKPLNGEKLNQLKKCSHLNSHF